MYIFLLVATAALGQDLPESNMPEVADPIIQDFLNDALERDLYLSDHLKRNLKGVYFLPKYQFKRFTGTTTDGRAGCLAHYHNYLLNRLEVMALLDTQYLNDADDMKVFVYHELGHFFGMDHDDSIIPAIMNSRINGSFLTPETIERFFRKLRLVPPAEYRSPITLN